MPRFLAALSFAFFVSMFGAHAESTATHDLVSFRAPKGWDHQIQGAVARATLVTSGASYCQVNVYRSVSSTGAAKGDFERDWRELVAAPFKIGAKPKPVRRPKFSGWKQSSGRGTFVFEGRTTQVALATYTAAGVAISILTLGNHKGCESSFGKFWAHTSLRLPSAGRNDGSPVATAKGALPAAVSSGYKFVVSSFDDGWRSTVQGDWVLVEKGPVRVYLYYALRYDASLFSGTGLMARDYYWREFVAKTFKVRQSAYRDDGEFVSSFKPPYVEGWGSDPSSGDQSFVAMTMAIAPNAAMLTVATAPSEQAFRQAFPKANDRWSSDLAAMSRYNKFAIAADDVVGTWQSGGSQSTQWYDSVTGAYAGATLAASSATFIFQGGGKYRSIHNGATGAVGAMSTFQQTYVGTYKVANYSLTATHRYQGRTDVFDAHFQAVRGGRLLALDDRRGGNYVLVRTKR